MRQDNASLLPEQASAVPVDRAMQPSATKAVRSADRLHVCFVAMNIYPTISGSSSVEFVGGAEVQQTILGRALVADGWRVSMLTGDFGQPELVDCDGVSVHRVRAAGMRGIKGLRFIHPHMTDVIDALRRIDPDIVYFRVAGFRAAAAAWYARTAGKAFVYACAHDTELAPEGNNPSTRRDAFLFRLALRSADAVLVQNVLQRQLLKDNFGKDGLILANCYVEPDAGVASPVGHVLWVGTVKPGKYPESFVELARRHPALKFRMVGGADVQDSSGQAYFDRIREEAAKVVNLEFVGHVPFHKVGRHFDDASLFVNTSAAEGFPNTFLQAWIRGVPTLSFVSPEVTPGQTGTIVCRDLEEMVARIGSLTHGGQTWAAASAACKDHFGRVHGIDSALQGYRELFGGLARRRAGSA
ncbi:MAG: glycosyltransferase family 4 protein [Burkholderiales bacterium]